ncbi:DUF1289 domain-containing protein [Candidatus Thiodictyon syntrophicum]|jgi:hypothetical protein|uniref:DUF1289 domain-containing protein n=1 Tax=Candidatus Thiodictyon syntrophicum TaxID=1166950 RepID=A0A2K8UC30_9GAMM|nr:DUF1289 domain-containing protein [Candidatus Thiodictyon syntrophicum]AUB83133.1 hypothetical protein THSYN_20755 [Candidatus Thiodictyon syntrophicum]
MSDPQPRGQPRAVVSSPCIDVCRLDPAAGLCLGCFRTLDEIAAWSGAADDLRLHILAAAARRREEQDPWQGDLRCDCDH